MTDPLGRVTQFGFDADGNLLFTQDPVHAGDSGSDTRSYRTVYDYDSFNRLGRVSQPKSTTTDRGTLIWTDTTYDPDNNITAVQDAHYGQQDAGDGPVTSHSYDPMGRLTLTTTPDTQADPAGQRTRMDYDAAGRLTSVILPLGVLSGIAKDHTTSYGYDAASELTSQTQYAVNSSGTVTDTRVTYYCYDDVGNTVSVTAPNAQLPGPPACPATSVPNTTFYTYDNAHQPMSVTDPNGNQRSVAYDGDGNVTQSTDANGNTTVSTYDQKDRLTKVVAPFVPGGRTTTTEYVYDPNGNKIKDISPRAYDASPDKTTFTDYVTSYSYDADNEMTTQTTPTDASTPPAYIHYYYDPGGRQTAVSLPVTQSDPGQVPADAKTTYTYSDPGWIATSQNPATPEAVHFTYTAQGWQETRIPENPSGGLDTALQQSWDYYPDGKTKSYTNAGGQSSAYHYDAGNNLTFATTAQESGPDQSPIEIYASYTPFDQLAATHYRPVSSSTYTGTAYTYDHDGNVTERDDNAQQTLASVTKNSQGVPVSWTFTQTGPPDVNTMTYDPADWLKTQNDKGTTSSCTGDKRIDTTWTPNGQEATSTINIAGSSCTYTPQQATAWAYFDNGLLHTQTTTATQNGTPTVVETHTLDYQAGGIYMNGNRTSDAYSLNGPGSTACTGTSPSCTATYSYNARDQLVSAADGHGGTTTYTYDQPADLADPSIRAGNITTQTSPAGTTTSTYNGNQLTTTATGGVTTRYWYDPLGRLTCVTTTPVSSAAYSYDALDRTAAETETRNAANLHRTTTFSYEGLTNLATQEIQATTGATTSNDTKTYTYDAYGTRISLADSLVSGGTTTPTNVLYGYNTHGDVSLLTDQSNGSVKATYGYTPYGAPDTTLSKSDTSLTTPFNPYQYSAKRFDSGSQTYDMGVRRYDPSAQRFLQADQFQSALSDLTLATDPLTQNRYDLAASNPLSAIEWDGHVATLVGGGGSPTPPPPAISTGSYINTPRFGPIGNLPGRPVSIHLHGGWGSFLAGLGFAGVSTVGLGWFTGSYLGWLHRHHVATDGNSTFGLGAVAPALIPFAGEADLADTTLATAEQGASRAAAGFEADSAGSVSDVRGLGRPDNEVVLSGHGGVDAGDTSTTRVPEGTCIAFYCAHGQTISDRLGNAIETGAPPPTEVVGPGRMVPDYWLEPPYNPDLNIEGNPVTVTQPTRLSELLRPNMGVCNWAACRDVG